MVGAKLDIALVDIVNLPTKGFQYVSEGKEYQKNI